MSFEKQRIELIDTCKNLLKEGKVNLVLGFAEGQAEMSASPFFIRTPEETDEMKWDDACSMTLAKYLLEKKEGAAIIAKPCDARAIVMYLAENQIERDKLTIIGVECAGMKGKDGLAAPGCEDCKLRIPPVYDILVGYGDGLEAEAVQKAADTMEAELSGKLTRFQKEMEKCILCFSCRQACYGCYCESCFIDREIPNWLPKELDTGAKMVFHLGRAMHLAGRCVECGACERVCPSGVNIRYLVKDLAEFCEALYGYQPGVNPEEVPAMTTFDMNDKEVGFIGGEHNEACCGS